MPKLKERKNMKKSVENDLRAKIVKIEKFYFSSINIL